MDLVSLSEKDHADVKLLNSLAATKYLFGRHEKAMSLLQLALWIDVTNERTLKMAVVVAWRLGEVNYAKAALAVLKEIGADIPDSIWFISDLYAEN